MSRQYFARSAACHAWLRLPTTVAICMTIAGPSMANAPVAPVSPTSASAPPTSRQSQGEKGGQKATDSFRLAERIQADSVTDASVAGKGQGEHGSLEEIIVP